MEPYLDTLITGGAILAIWLAGQIAAWMRTARDERDVVWRFVRERMGRHWPLLVALLAPLAAFSVPPQRSAWLLTAVAVVIAWWVGEGAGAFAQAPGLLRDPLRCAGVAACGLWRSRWLIAIFLGMWLLSGVIHSFAWAEYLQRDPVMREHVGQRVAETESGGLRERLTVDAAGDTLWSTIRTTFPSAVGQVGGGWAFAVLAMAVGFGYLRFGSSIPPGRRARMAWPFRLTVLMSLVAMQEYLWWLRPSVEWPGEPPIAAWLIWGVSGLSFVWAAPVTAASFHILLQVARGEHWNPRRALMAASDSWPLLVPLLLVVFLPSLLVLPLHVQVMTPGWLSTLTGDLPSVVHLALVLVPWIIIDRRVGLMAALRWSWAVATDRASDLMAFVLRYAAAMSVAMLALNTAMPSIHTGLSHSIAVAQIVVQSSVVLLGTLAIGLLYHRLSEETGGVIAKEPSEGPDADRSEGDQL